ncbi:Nn.00g029110.m01.CDS01 [Neocucurbitaria sp. VM-36]
MSTSAQSNIRHDLAVLPVDKWGWVIYRCSYDDADNETWARFRTRIEADSRETIAQSDAPEIADRLEWTWVEDRASLDGVSTAALRKRFRAWVADQVKRQPGNYHPSSVARFRYFIKIDKEVLQNLAGYLDDGGWSKGDFVKIVNADWEPSTDEEQDILEPIDGCTEKDVGWMRIVPCMIDTEFYDALNGDEMAWDDQFYKRPPGILLW